MERTHRRNILLMNLSLFTGFLFLPFGISVHIYEFPCYIHSSRWRSQAGRTSFTFSRTYTKEGDVRWRRSSARDTRSTHHVAMSIKRFHAC